MSSVWTRVCELCGMVAAVPAGLQAQVLVPPAWLHQDLGLLNGRSIDVCDACCSTRTVGALRDKLMTRPE